MGTSALARLTANLGMIGSLIALIGIVLISALLLCLIFRIVVGYMPNLPHAIGVVLLTAAVAGAIAIVTRMVLPPDPGDWVALGAALLAGGGWLDYQLLGRNGLRIGYRKAFLVQSIFLGICLLAWMAFVASTVVI